MLKTIYKNVNSEPLLVKSWVFLNVNRDVIFEESGQEITTLEFMRLEHDAKGLTHSKLQLIFSLVLLKHKFLILSVDLCISIFIIHCVLYVEQLPFIWEVDDSKKLLTQIVDSLLWHEVSHSIDDLFTRKDLIDHGVSRPFLRDGLEERLDVSLSILVVVVYIRVCLFQALEHGR